MLEAGQIRGAVETYARAISAGDLDAVVATFASDGTFEDPIGGTVMRGQGAIREYFRAAFAYLNGSILMEPSGEVRVAANHAACAFIARCPRAPEPFLTATLDTFEFDASGKFAKVQAYFGPENRHPIDWVDTIGSF